ncbi:hypothetical protein CONLIGDRAFT_646749 [Coniochaeta ligniaria NRRL 30616]|uniref:Uncharacterized protein n=1 Tax=Coniochaeta ligniaria NRRL 30616 TaxID=1408157 RepID=A0A1J7IFX1_9PEZI|nr:hypothetical protein CONLIGDRAFT_646749 [Coniochaeta ligniaria NRRL 30616]
MEASRSTDARQGSVMRHVSFSYTLCHPYFVHTKACTDGSESVSTTSNNTSYTNTHDSIPLVMWLNNRSTETTAVIAGLTRGTGRLTNIESVIDRVDNAFPAHTPGQACNGRRERSDAIDKA